MLPTATAQLLTSAEPRAQTDSLTGDVVVLPASYAPAASLKEAKPVFRNVAQRRKAKIGKKRNGYYKMPYGQDWGAGARLNRYDYAIKAPENQQPETVGSQAQLPQTHLAQLVANLTFFRSFSFGFGNMGLQ